MRKIILQIPHSYNGSSVTYRITKKDTVIKLVRTGIQKERERERERERESPEGSIWNWIRWNKRNPFCYRLRRITICLCEQRTSLYVNVTLILSALSGIRSSILALPSRKIPTSQPLRQTHGTSENFHENWELHLTSFHYGNFCEIFRNDVWTRTSNEFNVVEYASG